MDVQVGSAVQLKTTKNDYKRSEVIKGKCFWLQPCSHMYKHFKSIKSLRERMGEWDERFYYTHTYFLRQDKDSGWLELVEVGWWMQRKEMILINSIHDTWFMIHIRSNCGYNTARSRKRQCWWVELLVF